MNNKLTIEKWKKIVEIFKNLQKAANIDDTSIKYFFSPDQVNDDKDYFHRLCISLQNSGNMHNSIKFNDNEKIIKKVLCDYDFNKINGEKPDDIYKCFINDGIKDNGTRKNNKETNWEKFCKGIVSGANYLSEENNLKDVQYIINKGNEDIERSLNIISEIEKAIYGLGFALTCDWLKECGATWLVKPDIHVIEVYKSLTGSQNPDKKDIVKDMYKWADLIKKEFDPYMTAYKLDKIIWLICTGNFYKCDIKIGRELITKLERPKILNDNI